MPGYVTNPQGNTPVPLLQPGVPSYAFGKKIDGHPTVRALVTNVAITGNVATVTIRIVEGFIPVVGDLVSGFAIPTSAGLFDVVNIALTGVTINSLTGVGTITFPLVGSVASVASSGYVLITQTDIADTLTGSDQKSQQFAIQAAKGQGRGISWDYSCPSAPGSIAIQLEGAITDTDADYAIIGTSQTTAAGGTIIASVPELVNFVRLHVTASSGGSTPTIVGKLLLS